MERTMWKMLLMILLMNCKKEIAINSIKETETEDIVKESDYDIFLKQYREKGYITGIVTEDNSLLYNGIFHSIYFQLNQNDCKITVITNITDMESGWAVNQAEKYRMIIENNIYGTYIESDWIYSRPGAQFYWLDDDLFRMDFGSKVGPDSNSHFYSNKLNKISQNYFLATGYVDIENKLVLCADVDFVVYNIFNPEMNFMVKPNNMVVAGMKWFIIGGNTKFENGRLFLEYMINDDSREYEIKSFDLNKIIK